jgi:hypothetical protein
MNRSRITETKCPNSLAPGCAAQREIWSVLALVGVVAVIGVVGHREEPMRFGIEDQSKIEVSRVGIETASILNPAEEVELPAIRSVFNLIGRVRHRFCALELCGDAVSGSYGAWSFETNEIIGLHLPIAIFREAIGETLVSPRDFYIAARDFGVGLPIVEYVNRAVDQLPSFKKLLPLVLYSSEAKAHVRTMSEGELFLHRRELLIEDDVLRDGRPSSHKRQDSYEPSRSGRTEGSAIRGTVFALFGAASLVIAFYFIDGPRDPRWLRRLGRLLSLGSAFLIVQGTVLALTGEWILNLLQHYLFEF